MTDSVAGRRYNGLNLHAFKSRGLVLQDLWILRRTGGFTQVCVGEGGGGGCLTRFDYIYIVKPIIKISK